MIFGKLLNFKPEISELRVQKDAEDWIDTRTVEEEAD